MAKKDRVVFIRIAWMESYKGITENDKPIGGGDYIRKNRWGGEIYNFAEHKGYYYGGPGWARNFERIGGSEEGEKMDGVTVIWVGTNPHIRGQYIVGWYKNATIFKEEQDPPKKSNRSFEKVKIGYHIKAPVKGSMLLPVDDRVFEIPKAKKGKSGFGQVNVWYADEPEDKLFKESVLKYVKTGQYLKRIMRPKKLGKRPIQVDIEKRLKIEKKAVEVVEKYYERNYSIKDVSKDNKGWDLEATSGKIILFLEVKGVSGNQISVLMTPNEYEKMKDKQYQDQHRVCVVTNTLSKRPRLYDFHLSGKKWVDHKGNQLEIERITSARLYCD